MNSPSAALVWEIWRKNRWGFAALILILAMCIGLRLYVGYHELGWAAATTESWRQTALGWSILMIGFSGLVVFAMFGGAEPNAVRGFTGIPPRKFTLPISTVTLVAWPMTLGAATTAIMYFAWARLVVNPVLPAGISVSDSYYLSLSLAGLAAFQAVVWGLPSFPKTRVSLLTALILCLVALIGMPFFLQQSARSETTAQWFALQPTLTLGFVLIWVVSGVAAYFGVARERCGAWSGWRWPAILSRPIKWLSPPSFDYLSAFHAQCWIEWRRNGRLAVALYVPFLAIFLGSQFFPLYSQEPSNLGVEFNPIGEATSTVAFSAFLVWVALAGLNVARDASSKKLVLSSFTATRPLSTSSLLGSKLLAGAMTWLLGATAFLVCGVVTILVRNHLHLDQMDVRLANLVPPGYFRELPGIDMIVVGLALSLNVFVGILPLCLTGRIPGFPWSLLPLLMIYGLLFNICEWSMRQHDIFVLTFVLAWLVLLAKLSVAFWGFRRSLQQKLISPWFAIGYATFWLAGTATLAALALVTIGRAGWQYNVVALLPAAAVAIPLARIGLSPLALAMNRHQ